MRLEAKRGRIEVSGAPVVATPFNGRLVGPTLHVKPGDTIETLLVNATDQDTNIHFHGLHVSPKGIGDNVFRTFRPGTTVRSQVTLPRNHAPGTYWYHVHLHGLTEGQVMGGLSGLLVVEGSTDCCREASRGSRSVSSRSATCRRPAASSTTPSRSTRRVRRSASSTAC